MVTRDELLLNLTERPTDITKGRSGAYISCGNLENTSLVIVSVKLDLWANDCKATGASINHCAFVLGATNIVPVILVLLDDLDGHVASDWYHKLSKRRFLSDVQMVSAVN